MIAAEPPKKMSRSLAAPFFICLLEHSSSSAQAKKLWQGNKDSNLGMPESKSGALTSLAIPLH
jgi:hypothetical protein